MSLKRYHIYMGLLLSLLLALPLSAARVKDLAMIAGARDNQLVGYGLVVGLAGEGDKNQPYTLQSLANSLERHGIKIPAATLSTKNVAAVMVTADIPAFTKKGTRLDVTVSSLGDARTLEGGVLLQTPLLGADNRVYAVAQGPLSVGGISAGPRGGGGASVQKNHPTVGQIINGALIEKEIPATIVRNNFLELLMREPDFTSAARVAQAINDLFPGAASAVDSTTIQVILPPGLGDATVDFIARLEGIEVTPDTEARIIINERTGTIVATSRIQITRCAVAQGNLTITIASSLNVNQPNPLSQTGVTAITPQTETQVQEQGGNLVPLPDLPTVEEVAQALNALGVTPRDMMSIFQTMKQAGALHAKLIMR